MRPTPVRARSARKLYMGETLSATLYFTIALTTPGRTESTPRSQGRR